MNIFLPVKTVFSFLFIFLFSISHSLLAQTSATSTMAGTVILTNTASTINWNNLAGIQKEDNVFTTVLITGVNKTSANLDAQNWGFQSSKSAQPNYIPPNAVINGIRVFVKLRKTATGNIRENKVVLLKNGSEVPNNKALSNAVWPVNVSSVSYGDEVDLWGTNFSAADLTNDKFGVRIAVRNKGRKDAQAEIDHIKISVYFNQTIFFPRAPAIWNRLLPGVPIPMVRVQLQPTLREMNSCLPLLIALVRHSLQIYPSAAKTPGFWLVMARQLLRLPFRPITF